MFLAHSRIDSRRETFGDTGHSIHLVFHLCHRSALPCAALAPLSSLSTLPPRTHCSSPHYQRVGGFPRSYHVLFRIRVRRPEHSRSNACFGLEGRRLEECARVQTRPKRRSALRSCGSESRDHSIALSSLTSLDCADFMPPDKPLQLTNAPRIVIAF
jgi:hypothetical protein